MIHADADQLHQVLLNLIINAQQSLQDHRLPRRIRVTSGFDTYRRQLVRVTVADNGPGIPAHLSGRDLEPYFTTKPTGIGLGVGLAVSLGIVEAHEGTLTVACPGAREARNLPSRCPSVPSIRAQSKPRQNSKAGVRQRTILVIDDEAEIRETLADILAPPRSTAW